MTARRILISGASKGIGLATAQRLSQHGHYPVGLARSEPDGFPGEFIAVDLSDAAAAITFLLSEDAAFITGQTLRVDGGASVGASSI